MSCIFGTDFDGLKRLILKEQHDFSRKSCITMEHNVDRPNF